MSTEKKDKAERAEKRRQEEMKDRRSMAIYSVVAILVVVAAAALIVWNTGILQRSFTALEIGGTKYSAVDVQYYYNSIYSNMANQYAFDPSVSVKRQVRDQETGQTWYDYLVEQTVESMTDYTVLSAQAKSEGYVLSETAQAQRDAAVAQLDTAWISYGQTSRDDFIRASFGPHMTYDRLIELMDMEFLASDYANTKLEAIDHSDADYESYYAEHTDDLDTIVYTQLAFQAQVPAAEAEGMSDAQKSAALEEKKTEQKALAEEVKTKLEAGADPEQVAEDYQDRLYSTALSRRSVGSDAAYSTYGDWLLDSSRRAGDVTLSEYDSGTAYYYYVAVFEERYREEEELHDVRHILIRAGEEGTSPTQAEYDEAEEKAQALLDQWRAGEATEGSFAELASANSQDTSSVSSGGLYSGITSWSSYVEPFLDWAIDPVREVGDTDLVKTEYGWHIMYYVATNDPQWEQDAAVGLMQQDYEQLVAGAAQDQAVSRGMGMRFISA